MPSCTWEAPLWVRFTVWRLFWVIVRHDAIPRKSATEGTGVSPTGDLSRVVRSG